MEIAESPAIVVAIDLTAIMTHDIIYQTGMA